MKTVLLLVILSTCSVSQFFSQEWLLNIEVAQAKAAEEGKTILMVFQGSDWCAPCMKLEKEVWETEEFKEYAQEHFILIKVDFPRSRKNALTKEQSEHNKELAGKYNPRGHFPLVVILDSEGHETGSLGYEGVSALEYIDLLNEKIEDQ